MGTEITLLIKFDSGDHRPPGCRNVDFNFSQHLELKSQVRGVEIEVRVVFSPHHPDLMVVKDARTECSPPSGLTGSRCLASEASYWLVFIFTSTFLFLVLLVLPAVAVSLCWMSEQLEPTAAFGALSERLFGGFLWPRFS